MKSNIDIYVFILVVIFSIIPTITTRNFEFSHVIWFVTLYYIAGYIRKYPNKYTEIMAKNVKYSGMINFYDNYDNRV